MKEYIIRCIKYKRKNKFIYEYFDMKNNKINNLVAKKAINNLYIPPAYKDVRINLNQKEKILAIGYDDKDRPQYIYNKKFTEKNSKKENIIR